MQLHKVARHNEFCTLHSHWPEIEKSPSPAANFILKELQQKEGKYGSYEREILSRNYNKVARHNEFCTLRSHRPEIENSPSPAANFILKELQQKGEKANAAGMCASET
ncbi:hypothetical protein CDAR_484911 [Caerostris darwini]|uniref:Uncharacterized protein n=1 Tax=Caerostris darwini TaxID=1538125 RepID=A0AAV4PCC6_9ARAC|nr:hypothetical protein CDAR_484911 [Caerostris darwini]